MRDLSLSANGFETSGISGATLPEKAYVYVLSVVLFLTPVFPMPKEDLGYLSPAVFCGLSYFLALKLILCNRRFFWSRFAKSVLVLYLILLLSDSSVALRFPSLDETSFLLGRAVSCAIFLLFLGARSRRDRDVLDLFLDVLCWSAAILSLLILLESVGILSVGNETEHGRIFFGMRVPFRKATGLPMSDGKLGTILGPALLLLLLDNLTGLLRLPFSKSRLALVLVGIALAQSRSTWLGLSVCFAVFPFLLPRLRWKKLVLLFELMIFAALIYTGIAEEVVYGLMSEGIYQETVYNRINSYKLAIDYFLSSPLFGVGHAEVYHLFHGREMVVHNMFLDNLASTGIVGTLPLIGLFICYFAQAYRSYSRSIVGKDDRHSLLATWLILCMLHVTIELNLYRGFYNEYVQVYFAFLAMVTYGLRTKGVH